MLEEISIPVTSFAPSSIQYAAKSLIPPPIDSGMIF